VTARLRVLLPLMLCVFLLAVVGCREDQDEGPLPTDDAARDDVGIAETDGAPTDATVDNSPPVWGADAILTPSSITGTSFTLTWPPATDDVGVTEYRIYRDGVLAKSLPSDARSTALIALDAGATYAIRIDAVDAAGNVGPGPKASVRTAPPSPTPGPLDLTVATDIAKAHAFLYEGIAPLQIGVAPGAIEARRVAVLHGRVLDRAGVAVAGVHVAVTHHPDVGSTVTREDGRFDMVVQGGEALTLDYELTGFLPVARRVPVPYRDHVVVDDVTLTAIDPAVTKITLGTASPRQVAVGTETTDTFAKRKARLFFPEGTRAKLAFEDGSSKPVDEIHVRITEYSVGDALTKTSPAPIPDGSSLVYGMELTADEAIAAGAPHVTFDKPLALYIETTAPIPVGETLQWAQYQHHGDLSWMPERDGRVVKVIGVVAGLAVLDVDGTGKAATQKQLDALEITDAELADLATTFTVGSVLWRLEVHHFSCCAINWSVIAPDDARAPTPPPAYSDRTDEPDCNKPGSTIRCTSQALGERIPIAGTPLSLHYDSLRVPGRKAARRLTLPLSGASVPASLDRIEWSAQVAGRVYSGAAAPGPTKQVAVDWDGKDWAGRDVQGAQPITTSVVYVYKPKLVSPPKYAFYGGGRPPLPVEAREGIRFPCPGAASLGTLDVRADGFGGWAIDVVQKLDRGAGVVHHGGARIELSGMPWTIETVAGKPFVVSDPVGVVDIDARQAKLFAPDRVLAAPDGGFYFADYWPGFNSVVLRVEPGGLIRRVAGGGASLAEDVPATDAAMDGIKGLALGPDGALFVLESGRIRRIKSGQIRTVWGSYPSSTVIADDTFATSGQLGSVESFVRTPDGGFLISTGGGGAYTSNPMVNRIRRIAPDGFITTVAGIGGIDGYSGDGALARQAYLAFPRQMTFGPNGSLYFADRSNWRVREIRTDGRIYTVAGNGKYAEDRGDGGPATDASIYDPAGVGVAADGTLYLTAGAGVRAVRHGVIQRFAGIPAPAATGYSGDGGPAVGAILGAYADNLAVLADGSVVVTDRYNHVIRRVRRTSGEWVPDPSGGTASSFDVDGRQTALVNTIIGTKLVSFVYDVAGRIVGLTDASGQKVIVSRDASGNATTITGPYGHVTKLSYDVGGNLSRVELPDAAKVDLTYAPGSLLTGLIDARGKGHAYGYDELGRLTSDSSPDGASTTLTRTEGANGWTTSTTSASKLATTHGVLALGNVARTRTTTLPNGLTLTAQTDEGGSTKLTLPFDTTVTAEVTGDPRFGVLAPLAKNTIVTGGVISTMALRRVVTGTDPLAPATLTTYVDIDGGASAGGATATVGWAAATKTVIATSAAGRKVSMVLGAGGRVERLTPPGEAPIDVIYDYLGRATLVQQGTRSYGFAWDASANLTTITDPLGRTTTATYDSLGRLTARSLSGGRSIAYEWDPSGRLVSLTPPGRPKHTLSYGPAGLFTEYAGPLLSDGSGKTTIVRDADRRPTSIVRADGTSIGLQYDPDGTPTKIVLPDGEIGWTVNAKTKLPATLATAEQSTAYGWNGILLATETFAGVAPATIARTFDTRMRLAAETIGGTSIPYQYDADGYVTRGGDAFVGRDAATGRVTTTTIGAVVESWEYDAYGAPSRLTVTRAGTPLYDVVILRDVLGRVTQKTETVDGAAQVTKFEYHASGAISKVERDGVVILALSFDGNGNRLAATGLSTASGTYDARDRVLTYGTKTYTHGPHGEVTKIEDGGAITTYAYDALGGLKKVVLPTGKIVDYVLDGEGRRVARRVDAVVVDRFVYRGDLQVAAEVDGSGAVVSRYVYATRAQVPDYVVRGGVTYRVVADDLGSVRRVVDVATGVVVQRTDYDTFGAIVAETLAPGWKALPMGFAGGLHDRETGLVRFGAREYDPHTGRWTSRDPGLFRGGDANLYRYAHGDPVNFIDRDGKIGVAVAAVATIAALGVIIGMGSAAPSDTADAPADILGMALSASGLHGLPSFAALRPPPIQIIVNEDAKSILERTAQKWIAEFTENPELIKQFLKPGELRQVGCGKMLSANYGKALERAVAKDLQRTWPELFEHVGHLARPGKPIWDWNGLGEAAGRTFDLTTPKALAAHEARVYGGQVEFVLYEAPWPWNL